MAELNNVLTTFYERDIERLIDEIKSFQNDENIWRTIDDIKNSSGNLVLHIIGGSNYLIGKQLAKIDYHRNRENEFKEKKIARNQLIDDLEKLKQMVKSTLSGLDGEDLKSNFPIPFDGAYNSTEYVLIQLLSHLNYHLGQINYLRRAIEVNK